MSSTPAKIICRKCRLEYPGDALFCPNCGTARVQEDAADPMIGVTVGERYIVLERMGNGGSGTIYRAEHITLRRKVAVKVLHHELSRDDLAIERFRREATTVGQIENEHIVEIFDFGRTGDGRLYLAMELLEGETLADMIEREGQLEIDRAVDVLIQLGETLMEAHAMGYIHRDLRPRNVFLANRRGKGPRAFVKLLDFGLAKLVEKEGEAASTSLGMTFGDPHYMSPEQARGDALDRRADIYSLGCIAYEMLTGEPPFVGGKVFDVLTRHVEEEPVAPQERRSDVPTWLDHAVMRMLAKRPDQRFITVYRVIEALRQGSDSGHIMTDEVARRAETVQPSVSQAIARLGARGPGDMPNDLPIDLTPVVVPPATETAGVVAVEARRSGTSPAQPELPAPRVAATDGVGTATALGLGVGPTAGGKRAQLSQQTAARAAPSPPNGSGPGGSGGLSSAWYADGDAMDDEEAADPPQRRVERARRLAPGDTGLLARDDDEYAEPRRHPWRLAVIVGGAVLLGAAGVFALATGDDDAAPVAETEPPAGTLTAAATPAEPAAPAPAETATAAVDSAAADPAPEATASPPAEPARPARDRASKGEPTAPSPRSKLARAEGERSTSARKPARARGRFDDIGEDSAARRVPAVRPSPPRRRPEPTGGGGGEAGKAEFYAKLGDRDLASGDFLGAATSFNKARALDPDNATATLGLGEIALSQGSTDAALSHLRRAARLAPRRARAHTLLGEALLASGRKQQAAASFRRALKLEPGDTRAREGLTEATGQ